MLDSISYLFCASINDRDSFKYNTNPFKDLNDSLVQQSAKLSRLISEYKFLNGYENFTTEKSNRHTMIFDQVYPNEQQRTTSTASIASPAPEKQGDAISNVIYALGDVIAKRLREEISNFGLSKFKKYLNDRDAEIGNILSKYILPTTFSMIDQIETYQFVSLFQVLREAIHSDFTSLPANVKLYAESKVPNNPYLRYYLTGYSIIDMLMSKTYPAKIIRTIAESDFIISDTQDTSSTFNFSNSIKLAGFISECLKDTANTQRYWIDHSRIVLMLRDPFQRKYFYDLLKLFYTKQELKIAFKFTKREELQDHFNDLDNLIKSLAGYVEVIDNLSISINQTNATISKDVSIRKYLSTSVNFCTSVPRIIFDQFKIDPAFKFDDKYIQVIHEVADAVDNLSQGNFTSTFMHSLTIAKIYKVKIGNTEIDDQFIRYGTFLTSLIEAKSSDDMENAIETLILPAGSSSIKRKSQFNVSLNAFAGGMFGAETSNDDAEKNRSVGFTAPVGFAISWGNLGSVIGSISIFAPLIDLGSIVQFRLGNDTLRTLPTLSFENVLSPGILFAFGFDDSPISFSTGFQYGAQLRELKTTGATIKQSPLRFMLTLTADIPLLNFYTIPSDRK